MTRPRVILVHLGQYRYTRLKRKTFDANFNMTIANRKKQHLSALYVMGLLKSHLYSDEMSQ